MKLSTRATYGTRAMLEIARYHGGGPIMTKEIAELQHLPPTYLEQLMVQLRKAGLLSATRGAHGGYLLARPATEITLLEIIEALEGPLTLVECPGGTGGCCGTPESCALEAIWERASQALKHTFQAVTLAQLVEDQVNRESSLALMFNI